MTTEEEHLGEGYRLKTESADMISLNGVNRFAVITKVVFPREPILQYGFLAKFTEKTYNPLDNKAKLSLGTPPFYRDSDTAEASNSTPYYVDRNESVAVVPSKGATVDSKFGRLPVIGDMRLTWGDDEHVLFCTTMLENRRHNEGKLAVKYFLNDGNEICTLIRENNADLFAKQLGIDYGRWALEDLSKVYRKMRKQELLAKTSNAIVVIHGPVTYIDGKDRFLRSVLRNGGRADILASFIKDIEFKDQLEYRFMMQGWGCLKDRRLFLPVTNELRSLFYGCAYSNDLIRSLGKFNFPKALNKAIKTYSASRKSQHEAMSSKDKSTDREGLSNKISTDEGTVLLPKGVSALQEETDLDMLMIQDYRGEECIVRHKRGAKDKGSYIADRKLRLSTEQGVDGKIIFIVDVWFKFMTKPLIREGDYLHFGETTYIATSRPIRNSGGCFEVFCLQYPRPT